MSSSSEAAGPPAAAITGAAAAFIRAVRFALLGFARRMMAANARVRTRRSLGGLSDHALKDIGLHRSQIDAIELHPRYRPNSRASDQRR